MSQWTPEDQVAQLFQETREDLYRYLLTLGLFPAQAQEAAQEVYLRLFAAMKKGEDILTPRAWIFRVAHNLGLKVRSGQKKHPPFDPQLESRLADPARNPEMDLLEREKMLRVHRAMGDLSEQQRRCLTLRMEGLRYSEIAAVLGISTPTVSEFLRRAIARLRKAGHES